MKLTVGGLHALLNEADARHGWVKRTLDAVYDEAFCSDVSGGDALWAPGVKLQFARFRDIESGRI